MHAQQALLLDALDRNKAHVRAARRLADGRSVVGVVLAAVALGAIGGGQVGRDDASIQPHRTQGPGPVVCAGADLHHHHAAVLQQRTPSEELVAGQRPVRQHAATAVNGMHLDDSLREIHAYAHRWNLGILVHGLPLSTWLQIDDRHHQSWRFDAVA